MAKKPAPPKPAKSKLSHPSLLDTAKSLPPSRVPNFCDKLPPAERDELLELRRAFQAGELPPHIGSIRLYRDVVLPRFPELCAEATFRSWLSKRGENA